jgi:hypothetical protein
VAGVWDQVGFLFDTDDGSLPSVWVNGLGREGVAAAYAFIRSRCRTRSDGVFWHAGLNREERLDAWPGVALLVADDEATPFCFPAWGMAFGGVTLPWVGVYVWPGEVELFYRMGPEWDERRVLALFELLRRLAALSPDASVTLEPHLDPSVERRFLAAFSAYCRGRPASPPEPAVAREGGGRTAERRWAQCGNPDAMLALLGDKACSRRLRLFSAACCRRVWHFLEEPAFREAVEAAERFAKGRATDAELEAAWQATFRHRQEDGLSNDPLANARFWAADAASQAACDLDRSSAVASSASWAASWASGLPADEAFDRERAVQSELLRCIFGDPLRPRPHIDPACLAWGDGAVRRLARGIHESRRFEDMPVLADALEEAGCGDEGLLAHLRGPGPHAGGCHAVDLLLEGLAED